MSEPDSPIPPVAFVTGGSRGIGRAIVQRLAYAGLEVHFSYVSNAEAAQGLVDELAAVGKRAVATRADGREASAVEAAVGKVIAERGRIDVLINNAAITRDRLLAMMSDDEWHGVLDTSLNGLFGATRPTAKQMMRQRRGRIINITSVSGLTGIAGQTNYAAAKAAIMGFTRALAKELAPSGVPVNAVAPGFVDTDMLAGFSPQQKTAAIGRVPMKRFGTVEEIGNLVAYLSLEAPAFLTGQTIVIDGGMTA
ncbi:MAG: 3-oxoacyl-ACP reductase family protein [Polyangiales bacterium]